VSGFYRRAWECVTEEGCAYGGAAQPHHGVGRNSSSLVPKPSAAAFQCPAGPKKLLDPDTHQESRGVLGLGWCRRWKALAIDVGTTSIRTAIVDANGTVTPRATCQRLERTRRIPVK